MMMMTMMIGRCIQNSDMVSLPDQKDACFLFLCYLTDIGVGTNYSELHLTRRMLVYSLAAANSSSSERGAICQVIL